jgi:hypothetical protein
MCEFTNDDFFFYVLLTLFGTFQKYNQQIGIDELMNHVMIKMV